MRRRRPKLIEAEFQRVRRVRSQIDNVGVKTPGYVRHAPEGVSASRTIPIADIQLEIEGADNIAVVEFTRPRPRAADIAKVDVQVMIDNIPKHDPQIGHTRVDQAILANGHLNAFNRLTCLRWFGGLSDGPHHREDKNETNGD